MTKSQKIVLGKMMKPGIKNQQIADSLFVSVKTIKNHINLIYKAMNVKNRKEAIMKAAKSGLVLLFLASLAYGGEDPLACDRVVFKPVKQTSFVHGYAFGREDAKDQALYLVNKFYMNLSTSSVVERLTARRIYYFIDHATWRVEKSTVVVTNSSATITGVD